MRKRTVNSASGLGRMLARLVTMLPVLVIVAGCSTWGSVFGDKDENLPDEPADRLYNEGLFLLNEKKEYEDAAKKFEEVDRQHPDRKSVV